MPRYGQNLEAQGLTGKILRNKDLASGFEWCKLCAVSDSLEDPSRMFPILCSSDFSVKVVRHKKRVEGCGKMCLLVPPACRRGSPIAGGRLKNGAPGASRGG